MSLTAGPSPWLGLIVGLAGAALLWRRQRIYRMIDDSFAELSVRPEVGLFRALALLVRAAFVLIAMVWTLAGVVGLLALLN